MLNRMLRKTTREFPRKTAVVYGEMRLSYSELERMVEGLAAELQARGIRQSGCVAMLLPNCPEFLVGFYATARLNAICLPLNPMLKRDELAHFFEDSKAGVVIADASHIEACESAIAKLDRDIALIAIDGDSPHVMPFTKFLGDDSPIEEKADIYEGDVLYAYSSGSTGRPKQVCRTQKNLVCEANNFTTTTECTSEDNILCVVPLFHAHGMGNCLLAATRTGATLTILEPVMKDGRPVEVPFVFRRDRVLELIEQEQVTVVPGVPYIFSALAESPKAKRIDSLRLVFSAGNFLSRPVFDKFRDNLEIPIRQLYGCTEAGSVTINLEPAQDIQPDSIGVPLRNVEMKIVDDDGNELPNNVSGEIVFKSPALTDGYRNMPELNKDAFKEGAFLTGDLGKRDDQGRFYITGRKKIFIDQGGYKVDPFEVEDVLSDHPKVNEVVVVGVEGPYEGEIIKAVVVPEGECDKREIISYCKERLAEFKIPKIVEFREEIPKSPLGKILRKDLI